MLFCTMSGGREGEGVAVKVGVAALHAVLHKGQLRGGKLPAIAFFVFVEAQTFAQTQLQDEIIFRTAAASMTGAASSRRKASVSAG